MLKYVADNVEDILSKIYIKCSNSIEAQHSDLSISIPMNLQELQLDENPLEPGGQSLNAQLHCGSSTMQLPPTRKRERKKKHGAMEQSKQRLMKGGGTVQKAHGQCYTSTWAFCLFEVHEGV